MSTDVRTIRVWDSKIGKVEDVRIDAAGESRMLWRACASPDREDDVNTIEEDY